jgi:hypothetical protein
MEEGVSVGLGVGVIEWVGVWGFGGSVSLGVSGSGSLGVSVEERVCKGCGCNLSPYPGQARTNQGYRGIKV